MESLFLLSSKTPDPPSFSAPRLEHTTAEIEYANQKWRAKGLRLKASMGLSHTLPWLSSNKLSRRRLKGSMRSHSGTRKARQKMRSPGSLFPWKSGFCVVSGLAQYHPQSPGGIPWVLSAYFHCWTTEGEIIDGSRYVHPVSIGFHQDEKAPKNVEVIVQCIKEWWWKTSSGLQLSTSMLTECVHVTVK